MTSIEARLPQPPTSSINFAEERAFITSHINSKPHAGVIEDACYEAGLLIKARIRPLVSSIQALGVKLPESIVLETYAMPTYEGSRKFVKVIEYLPNENELSSTQILVGQVIEGKGAYSEVPKDKQIGAIRKTLDTTLWPLYAPVIIDGLEKATKEFQPKAA